MENTNDTNYGYDIPLSYGSNYKHLIEAKAKRSGKKKAKRPNVINIIIPAKYGGLDRVKKLAEKRLKRHTTMIVDYILEGVVRDEKLFE